MEKIIDELKIGIKDIEKIIFDVCDNIKKTEAATIAGDIRLSNCRIKLLNINLKIRTGYFDSLKK